MLKKTNHGKKRATKEARMSKKDDGNQRIVFNYRESTWEDIQSIHGIKISQWGNTKIRALILYENIPKDDDVPIKRNKPGTDRDVQILSRVVRNRRRGTEPRNELEGERLGSQRQRKPILA